jgi:hypothetical protein
MADARGPRGSQRILAGRRLSPHPYGVSAVLRRRHRQNHQIAAAVMTASSLSPKCRWRPSAKRGISCSYEC